MHNTLHNVFDTLERPDKGLILYRVPAAVRETLNFGAHERSKTTSGVELRFIPIGAVEIVLERYPCAWDAEHSLLEVWFGAHQHQIHVLQRGKNTIVVTPLENPPLEMQVVRVFLPIDCETHLLSVRGEYRVAPPSELPKLLVYGSSITCGASTVLPSQTYPQLLARGLGFECLNFGFPGSARLELPLAEWLATQVWDVAVLELGVNVFDVWEVDVFAARAAAFVKALAATGRKVYCTDLYTSFYQQTQPEKALAYAEAVRAAARRENCRYVRGSSLLQWSGLSSDLLHPSVMGMQQIAAAWLAQIAPSAYR